MLQKNFLKRKSASSNLGIRNWRIYFFIFSAFAFSSVIFLRLYSLQVAAYSKYRMIAENQHKIFETLSPERGSIYLQDQKDLFPLAVNEERQMAYAIPKEIENREETAKKLSSILELDEGAVREKISDENDVFEILKHKLNGEEIEKIKELGAKGIHLTPEKFRLYPGGELACHVVGFVGSDGKENVGRYGLEFNFEKELSGEKGNMVQERDSRGGWISIGDREIQPAKDGKTMVLTINNTVQYEVENILRETVEKHGAENGTAIVMEPETGKILAMANFPSFNPNEYGKVEDMSLFVNNAVNTPYECGSVFKTITIAAGIDDGKISPETEYIDTGLIKEAGYDIKNSDEKSYGRQTMTQVLEKSLNTGAIYAEKLVGNKKFADYIKNFGFGEKTGVDLPFESSGNVKSLDYLKRNINFYTASFGQGITVTPLQLLNAYSAIANGGKLMKPQIVDKIVYGDGRTEEIKPEEMRRVISEDSSKLVGKMLRSVVANGHGKRADVPGHLVGGKTGTAQVAKVGSRGYEEGITIGTFAGYAPIEEPKFSVLVKIYNPKDVQWAESTAAPAFGKIMKFLLEYYKVEPTEEIDK